MTETCVVCSKALQERYRLRDRFGKPTQLGTVIEYLLDKDLCEGTTSTVCRKCRYSLLHLEKLKREDEELKCNLKSQLRNVTAIVGGAVGGVVAGGLCICLGICYYLQLLSEEKAMQLQFEKVMITLPLPSAQPG